ncbi:MAG TPA: amidotransferase [Blastocatellia bacterium]|nr:amidotransferase [Blastocatellia bacterium]
MKIGLLECDHVLERFRHIAGDYRDMFAALFHRHAPQITLRAYDTCNGEVPSSLDSCDAYLTTGSRFSAYDDVDWIHALKNFVRRIHEAKKPFVGVCFGHQIMAEALGGKVARAEVGWGVGVHSVEVISPELWMRPEQSSCGLQYMHQDQVERLPEDGVVIGRSDHCPVAMFRIGDSTLGIQAHPEFPKAYSEALLLDRIERIGGERVNEALASLDLPTDESVVAKWIVEFLEGRTRKL